MVVEYQRQALGRRRGISPPRVLIWAIDLVRTMTVSVARTRFVAVERIPRLSLTHRPA